MKRLITLLLLMFVALGANAQTSSSAPQLTPKESLYGTWVLSMRELVGSDDVPDMSLYFNFARDNKLYIHSSSVVQTGDYSLMLESGKRVPLKVQYDCSVYMTIDWSATASEITFSNVVEGKERYWVGNLYIKNGYEQYSKYIPHIEDDIRASLEFVKSLHQSSKDVDGTPLTASLPYKLLGSDRMQWQIEELPPFTLKRYSQIKPSKSVYTLGEPIEISYLEGGVVCDPDEYAFLSLSRYDESGEWASAWFSDTPTEIGTYRYIAEDDGYNSNMAIVRVVPALQLNVYGYEATEERHRRVVRSSTDSEIVADRYAVIGDNHLRIMPGDSVRVEVVLNGRDVTADATISYNGGVLAYDREILTKANRSYNLVAQFDNHSSNIATVETADSLHLNISPTTVELGDTFRYSVYRGSHTNNELDLKLLNDGYELRGESGDVVSKDAQGVTPQQLGTYRYYATDGRVCSNPVVVDVVEPKPIVLSIKRDNHRRFTETAEGKYFMQLDRNPLRFRVMQGDKDITRNTDVYNKDGKLLQYVHDIRHPGVYEFYATKGRLKSKPITLVMRDFLSLRYDRDIFDEEGVLVFTAMQDSEDVTAECRITHRHRKLDGEELLKSNTHVPTEDGFHSYWAYRAPIYESFARVLFVRDGRPVAPSADLVIEVERDTITLGEELHFTTLLKGKPTKATIYDLDEQEITSPYTPLEPGEYTFVARKGKIISEPLVVLVLPKDDEQ